MKNKNRFNVKLSEFIAHKRGFGVLGFWGLGATVKPPRILRVAGQPGMQGMGDAADRG